MLYEHDYKKGKRKEMGIVLKRRDNAPIVKDIYGGVIDILMKEQNIKQSLDFLIYFFWTYFLILNKKKYCNLNFVFSVEKFHTIKKILDYEFHEFSKDKRSLCFSRIYQSSQLEMSLKIRMYPAAFSK